MQKECEKQLKRINKEIEEFESRKEKDVEDLAIWKDEQLIEVMQEKEALQKERAELIKDKEASTTIINS
jgi:hypothetical protein